VSGWPETTWDGLPVSREPPYGVAVLVWRDTPNGVEWLLLHRHHHGADFEGDWAWTPPAGARLPGEPLAECARRELHEEAGFDLELVATDCGTPDWPIFLAQSRGETVVLSAEHDRFVWVSTDEAAARCLPTAVGDSFPCVAALVHQHDQRGDEHQVAR
jgi:8-oxo-dGTP pyrophosphatase MutT (NUDIX family)